jgi:hypothetical protein
MTGSLSNEGLAHLHRVMAAHVEAGEMPGLVTIVARTASSVPNQRTPSRPPSPSTGRIFSRPRFPLGRCGKDPRMNVALTGVGIAAGLQGTIGLVLWLSASLERRFVRPEPPEVRLRHRRAAASSIRTRVYRSSEQRAG